MNDEYYVNLDVVDYKILLDSSGRVHSVCSRNVHFEEIRERPDFNTNRLREALRILFLYEPEKFNELYATLQANDPEMFVYATLAVNSPL